MLRCKMPRRADARLARARGTRAVPAVAGAWPWSMDMANQISIKPQHGPDSIRPFPQRSVPMAGTNTLIHVHDRDGAWRSSIRTRRPGVGRRGRKFFQIFCTPCHGKSGTGDGTVGAKFLIRPFDSDRRSGAEGIVPEGYIFGTVTFGGALMPLLRQ
jgi:S-disulfanyl-L-cysteine oxidoreductase SoxD